MQVFFYTISISCKLLSENLDILARQYLWNMNLDYKLKKLDSWNYSTEILYAILKYDSEPAVIQKIITNYNIDLLNYDKNTEITVEVNPESATKEYLKGLKFFLYFLLL